MGVENNTIALASAEVSSIAQPRATVIDNRLPIILSFVAVCLIWGSTYFAIKNAILGGFPPYLMLATRFLVAGGLLYGFLRLRGVPNPPFAQWRAGAALGAFMLVGGLGSVTLAEQWVGSGLAALAVSTMPLWTVLFTRLWGYRSNRLEWIGLFVGLAGIVILNFEGEIRANPLGAVLLIISPISWAFGSALSRRLTLPDGPMVSAVEMLGGGALLAILSPIIGERLTRVPDGDAIWAVGYLIVFGSLIAFLAYNYLLSHVRPALATSYAYVNPVVAIGLGGWFADEKITIFGLLALPVILTGVALIMFARERSSKEAV